MTTEASSPSARPGISSSRLQSWCHSDKHPPTLAQPHLQACDPPTRVGS